MSDRSGWKAPTLRECYTGALANAKDAEEKLKFARARVKALAQGHSDLPEARALVQQHVSEVAHWHDYAGYYRKRCEEEGDLVVPRALMRGSFG